MNLGLLGYFLDCCVCSLMICFNSLWNEWQWIRLLGPPRMLILEKAPYARKVLLASIAVRTKSGLFPAWRPLKVMSQVLCSWPIISGMHPGCGHSYSCLIPQLQWNGCIVDTHCCWSVLSVHWVLYGCHTPASPCKWHFICRAMNDLHSSCPSHVVGSWAHWVPTGIAAERC